MKKLQDELHRAKHQKSKDRILALIKSSMDIVVGIGVLRLAPFIVTPRVTGAFGFITSLISCYQVKQCLPYHKPTSKFTSSSEFLQNFCYYTVVSGASQVEDTLKQEEAVL